MNTSFQRMVGILTLLLGSFSVIRGEDTDSSPRLYRMRGKGTSLWGFIDKEGKLVIPRKFNYVEDFYEGLAIFVETYVTEDNRIICKRGFIDKKGAIAIPAQYRFAKAFSGGLAAVEIDKKWGYIDRKGTVVIKPVFSQGHPFSEGLAAVSSGEKWSYIDKKGDVVIKAEFDAAEKFSQGLALVQKGEKWGFVDKKGTLKTPLEFDFGQPFSEGLAAVEVNEKWGFIDKSGKIVITPNYHYTLDFNDGLALVGDGSKFGYINKLGEVAIPLKYTGASSFREGLAAVYIYGKMSGYINTSGKIHFEMSSSKANLRKSPMSPGHLRDFSRGFGMTIVNYCIRYFDKDGTIVFWDHKSEPNGVSKITRQEQRSRKRDRFKIIWPGDDNNVNQGK